MSFATDRGLISDRAEIATPIYFTLLFAFALQLLSEICDVLPEFPYSCAERCYQATIVHREVFLVVHVSGFVHGGPRDVLNLW